MIHDESTSKIPAVSRDTRQDASLIARLGLPSPPIFLRFAFHCRRIRILALDPVARAAGRIRGVATLRHDPLQAQLAGMLENERPSSLSRCSLNRSPGSARARARSSNAFRWI